MATYVRETSAGKSISAWVILKGRRQVATVQAHYSNSGRVLVNVWQRSEAAERSALAAERDGLQIKPEKYMSPMSYQQGSASGYGYDKFTAALSGLYIDGHAMTDHCSRRGAPKPPKGRKTFPRGYQPPKGYQLANFVDGSKRWVDSGDKRHPDMGDDESGYRDCYRLDALKYLEAKGYTVISAI